MLDVAVYIRQNESIDSNCRNLSYLGSPFHDFWSRCGDHQIHPEDQPFFSFDKKRGIGQQLSCDFETDDYGPWPFDGALDEAKVVVCYANALFNDADKKHKELIRAQRSGNEDLPSPWDWYYQSRIATPMNVNIASLRRVVSIFNVCPYPSNRMLDKSIRFAAGLPSVWAAQKHLREVLIPKAQSGEIFLVFARKHQLWGVVEGFECPTIAFSRNIGGYLGPVLGGAIQDWLEGGSKWKS